jgi:hypothetical protein
VQQLHTDITTASGNAPADPTANSADDFNNAFFSGTFSGLLAWQLPSHTSTCPTGSFDLWGQTFTLDVHCGILEGQRSLMSTVSVCVWTILGLFIVLGA